MEAITIIPINEARSILREFNAPVELQEEKILIDIINRLDSIAYIYNSANKNKVESSEIHPLAETQPVN